MNVLSVTNLSMRFGGIMALNQVSFAVSQGSITALIGPNGAGKTTAFNCITGFYQATQGEIQLHLLDHTVDIRRILGQPFVWQDLVQPGRVVKKLFYRWFGGSHLVNRAGVARTFQHARLFREMTVLENLLVAQNRSVNCNPLAGLFATRSFRHAEAQAIQTAAQWLHFMGLKGEANLLAGALPYGHQRRLEIARALCTKPKLICLDEPAAGLNPIETKELCELIRRIRDMHHISVLLIEHDMSLVMEISDHVVVLDHGEVIASGTPEQIRRDPKVLEAYLGTAQVGDA
ncbi:MAG: ATP-binding cassette domain-containing protein [Magnetococcus sp. DMHC-6]